MRLDASSDREIGEALTLVAPHARWAIIIIRIKADIEPAVGKMIRSAGDGCSVRSPFMISS
jgi:hypothetical protein